MKLKEHHQERSLHGHHPMGALLQYVDHLTHITLPICCNYSLESSRLDTSMWDGTSIMNTCWDSCTHAWSCLDIVTRPKKDARSKQATRWWCFSFGAFESLRFALKIPNVDILVIPVELLSFMPNGAGMWVNVAIKMACGVAPPHSGLWGPWRQIASGGKAQPGALQRRL
jgi:hypothetical protein